MKAINYTISILLLSFLLPASVKAQGFIDLESGMVIPGYNDVRIPGDEGTLFSLRDDLNSNNTFFYRLRVGYTINSRHTISLLYAPLQTRSEGNKGEDILFAGALYPANTALEGTYKFNSYRLTYRYDLVKNPDFEFGLGLTAKIRDARIALSSADTASEKTDLGFVPIINIRLLYNLNDDFGLLLDGDALAAPQGRAVDILIAGTYNLTDNTMIRAGYRILEGGADNDEVYNFSLFNYASIGVTYTFNKPETSN